jgi:hypothetical protein
MSCKLGYFGVNASFYLQCGDSCFLQDSQMSSGSLAHVLLLSLFRLPHSCDETSFKEITS